MDLFSIFSEIGMAIFALALIRGAFKMRNSEESRFGKSFTCVGTEVISHMFFMISFMWAFDVKEKGGVAFGITYIVGDLIVHYWNFSDLIKKAQE